jgi:hypothetical protein
MPVIPEKDHEFSKFSKVCDYVNLLFYDLSVMVHITYQLSLLLLLSCWGMEVLRFRSIFFELMPGVLSFD